MVATNKTHRPLIHLSQANAYVASQTLTQSVLSQVKVACRVLQVRLERKESLEWTASLVPRGREETQVCVKEECHASNLLANKVKCHYFMQCVRNDHLTWDH